MIKLGTHSYCYGTQRGSANDVIVGNYSSIAENTVMDGGFNHDTSNVSTFPFASIWTELPSNIKVNGHIYIGSDVWIGEGCFIMSGVTIGDGAIVGANSVVTKDIPPYTVVAGSPARIRRRRFSSFEIEQLLIIKWWEWDEKKVKDNVHLLQSHNIHEFIKTHKR